MADNVNHPAHYETGKFECIDVMVETQGVEATQNFCVCNALKYVYRHKKKNGMEDLQKAIWYLNKAVELESQSEKALAEVETQSEKALNTYYAERNEKIGLDATATAISALMQQAYSLTESFKEKVKAEYPGVDTLCGYYGSISYKLANMSSQAEIRSCLLKEFEDGRTEIRKGIKARKNEMIKGITDNYRNVIANVSNMKNAKLAMEYLKNLGFDLSELVKADENPVTTALSVEVDTRFLFIGGKKNEVE